MNAELGRVADLALFARIVQSGGIKRCADNLGMQRTTVSRRVAKLERTLGVRLFHRNGRQLSVTQAGQRCFEHCEALLELTDRAFATATNAYVAIESVPIIFGAPPDLLERYLEPAIAEFEALHDGVSIERVPMTDWSGTEIAPVDVGVTWERPGTPDCVVGDLCPAGQSLYASRDYLERRGEPVSPYELDRHLCITPGAVEPRSAWRFEHPGKDISVSIENRYRVRTPVEAREAAVAGLGISRLPNYLCESSVADGQLVRVLPRHSMAPKALMIASPSKKEPKPRAVSLKLHLSAAFAARVL